MSQEININDLNPQELLAQLENAINVNENLKKNQEQLIAQNNQYQAALQQSQNSSSIFRRLLEVKKDLGYVGKDQKNSGQGWMFRGIDQFLNTVKPLFDKHGVGVLPSYVGGTPVEFVTNDKTGKKSKVTCLIMKYTFFAEDGSTVEVSVPAEGVDPGDKGTNKALSAAMKYALIQTFSIPTQDMAEADKENLQFNDSTKTASTAKKAPSKSADSSEPDKAPAKKSFRRKATSKPKVSEGESGGIDL